MNFMSAVLASVAALVAGLFFGASRPLLGAANMIVCIGNLVCLYVNLRGAR